MEKAARGCTPDADAWAEGMVIALDLRPPPSPDVAATGDGRRAVVGLSWLPPRPGVADGLLFAAAATGELWCARVYACVWNERNQSGTLLHNRRCFQGAHQECGESGWRRQLLNSR